MNAVEIEQAISELAEQPYDPAAFPFEFLRAFGSKETTLRRLRSGETNKSDVGGVLQVKHIHLAVSPTGEVTAILGRLRKSQATGKHRVKFILSTDGESFEAEDLTNGETVACTYADFPNHFGFFLPLAGISTVKQIRESSFDIRATSRLNRLYVQLLKDNPEWGTAARRPDMNHFMARLIFCFFAEDTDIFPRESRFTTTVEQMSARDSSNTHEVIQTLFLAMNTKQGDRAGAGIPRWALGFPYVNGGLFSGNLEVATFSKIARSYLLHIGNLDWTQINPDIFGSMIQAVAEDEERGELGMHYTSVPNILKVLNPLFIDELREKLEESGDNNAKLLNLRKRIARIRVFDPACGSGNFLVIAYKEMRAIEAEINRRRGEEQRPTDIPLTNFRGIELRDFAAEIARLALIIAEYQCDVLYRGSKLALAEFLPLEADNWITCGNALRLDWLSICPPTGAGVKLVSNDLFEAPLKPAVIDFENEGGETYICGNPPYAGKGKKSRDQIKEMDAVFGPHGVQHGYIDYVGCWFVRAAEYAQRTQSSFAFVATNSVNRGHQVPLLWPLLHRLGQQISFAYTPFKWQNLATHNAGVIVVVIGMSAAPPPSRPLFALAEDGDVAVRLVPNINAYLAPSADVVVQKRSIPLSDIADMGLGNMPYDGGHLLMSDSQKRALALDPPTERALVRRIYGSREFTNSLARYCLWIEDKDLNRAQQIAGIADRITAVRVMRQGSEDPGGRSLASRPHQLREMRRPATHTLVVPRTSSESREYLPAGMISAAETVSSEAFAILDGPLWQLALLVSRLHILWIGTVCGQLKKDFRYSNELGWNTFPVPTLTDKNKEDLTRCAEDILLVREAHFPATIADLYDPEAMPADLKAAHQRNDEVLERIYIGRRFRNDTERLEKLFELYTKMTTGASPAPKKKSKRASL